MGLQQFILALLVGSSLVFGFYYMFTIIYIHKKIFDKYFYFVIFCIIGSAYIFFQLLLSLPQSQEQYLLFHKLKGINAIIILPITILLCYEQYFNKANKIIPYIMLGLSPIFLALTPTKMFLTLPVHEIKVQLLDSTFTYHIAKSGIVYSSWSIILVVATVSSIIYFYKNKNKIKRIPFVIIILAALLFGGHDTLVGQGILSNIMISEYGFFLMIAFIFIDFIKEDRKAYLSVFNLSGELQKHKEELEITVEERTKELQIEKAKTEELLKKSDGLLLNILPDQIAERLKQGEQPIADHFDEASVIFIDIVDFTKISSKSTPQKMVNMLNNVFTEFDKIAEKYGIEKIKTIGDCYMAAAGIPIHRPDHAEAIARMAIESMEKMNGFITEDGHEIKFRVGLDCGPIVAGVIGKQKFIYDLWGDMVNTASRMETNGIIGRIQCTERFRNKLGIRSEELGIKFEERGEIDVKGKGMMKTYFIN